MENEIRWKAVETNDRRFDGAFVYGVRSTGIYCRPSCSSRLPKRENVDFFDACADAESNGFRACMRCQPASEVPAPQVAKVIAAAELLDRDETISLSDLADEVGLSPARLQKLFKELIGVSPKKFADSKRLERFKEGVRGGAAITDSMYDAGYGSSSRLYENIGNKLGMTPRAYTRKGSDMQIEYTITDSDLGRLLVARTSKGVCAVNFGDNDADLETGLRKEYANAEIERNGANLKDFVDAILHNLDGSNPSLDLPLDLRATAFQMRVWEELRKIPYGETLSYQKVADKIGKPKSVRAVAAACAANRVALVIPCHRVVRSNGDVSGYKWGVERKRVILKREAARE